eukprot:1023826-Rhodomonas_salina.1
MECVSVCGERSERRCMRGAGGGAEATRNGGCRLPTCRHSGPNHPFFLPNFLHVSRSHVSLRVRR